MPHEITRKNGFVEVRVWGDISMWDVLKIVHQLSKEDPKKELPDVWNISEESSIPFHQYAFLAKSISTILPVKRKCARSALVASNKFQKAQLDLYCHEIHNFPFETRTFLSCADAREWVLDTPAA